LGHRLLHLYCGTWQLSVFQFTMTSTPHKHT
jgi:hypothetical protein